MPDVQYHHMYNRLAFDYGIVENKMIGIVVVVDFVVEDEVHFVDIERNRMDNVLVDEND